MAFIYIFEFKLAGFQESMLFVYIRWTTTETILHRLCLFVGEILNKTGGYDAAIVKYPRQKSYKILQKYRKELSYSLCFFSNPSFSFIFSMSW